MEPNMNGNLTQNNPEIKFINMWEKRLSSFNMNPRGFKELENYALEYNIKIFFRRRLKVKIYAMPQKAS